MNIFPYRLLFFSLGIGAIITLIHMTITKAPENWETQADAAKNDQKWIPKGFDKYDRNFATKWKVGVCDPRLMHTCVEIEVASRTGCKNLYVEATELSKDDSNIGYTNATTAGLREGEIAKMILNSTKTVGKYRLSEIKCY
jgi:hypothetical protein